MNTRIRSISETPVIEQAIGPSMPLIHSMVSSVTACPDTNETPWVESRNTVHVGSRLNEETRKAILASLDADRRPLLLGRRLGNLSLAEQEHLEEIEEAISRHQIELDKKYFSDSGITDRLEDLARRVLALPRE